MCRAEFCGKVVHGRAVGRTIGFPTANLDVDAKALGLENGVYAAWVSVGELEPSVGAAGDAACIETTVEPSGRNTSGRNTGEPPQIRFRQSLGKAGSEKLKAVLNIGTKPSFAQKDCSVEVYILDFEGDIYNKELKVELVEKLREEKKFGSIDLLKQQIAQDVELTRQILRNN